MFFHVEKTSCEDRMKNQFFIWWKRGKCFLVDENLDVMIYSFVDLVSAILDEKKTNFSQFVVKWTVSRSSDHLFLKRMRKKRTVSFLFLFAFTNRSISTYFLLFSSFLRSLNFWERKNISTSIFPLCDSVNEVNSILFLSIEVLFYALDAFRPLNIDYVTRSLIWRKNSLCIAFQTFEIIQISTDENQRRSNSSWVPV